MSLVTTAVFRLPNVAILPADRVHGRQERNVRPEQHVIADAHRRAVQTGEVEVHEYAIADGGMAAVVEEDRSHDVEMLAVMGDELVEDRLSFGAGSTRQSVVSGA